MAPLARRAAASVGAVDVPGGRRIHSAPTPRFGGLAIYLGLILSLVIASRVDHAILSAWFERPWQWAALALCASGLVLMGLVDDRRSVRPAVKLLLEVIAAIAVVLAGFRIDSIGAVGISWLAAPVTIIWIVAVTNAINLVDGLDGLAPGVGLIASLALFSVSVKFGNVDSALVLAALSGALLGFLPYNFPAARMFLGDSGSLLVGFLLAVAGIQSHEKTFTAAAMTVPLLALGLPLAELVLTVLRRLLRQVRVLSGAEHYRFGVLGRPALFTADLDHIHHRLLGLGISARTAVLGLWGICTVLGMVALLAAAGANRMLVLAVLGIAGLMAIRWLDYAELQPLRSGLWLPLFDLAKARPSAFYVLGDAVFASVALVGAYAIAGDGALTREVLRSLVYLLPILVATQTISLLMGGLYSRPFRNAGLGDVLVILRAIGLAVALGWLVAGSVWRPSLSVTVLDAYLLATLIIGSRLSLVVLDYIFASARSPQRRVVI